MLKPSLHTARASWAQVLRQALAKGWAALRKHSPKQSATPATQHSPGTNSMAGASQPEAWLDMEQLVDFYMALGMTGAAVDVLTEHLKAADWAGPLPYLKLLDVHAQDDNRNAYLLTKTLLEQRFAMTAPEWPWAATSRPTRLQEAGPSRPYKAKRSPTKAPL